ncbi:hypothetical protein Fmac_003847 [Flemingia macrophylla]|uniref:Avr9/Cf-9 rapidly elicited protein 146 n=1 Tax=Flemingia macrophylla TaxID=520843 RepID=A0ABD1N394_9FABA
MEMEASTPVVAKKLWNMVRVLFFMVRKGIAKSKIMAEFHLLLKRGKKAMINNLMLNHRYYMASFTCHDHRKANAFISPSDYEFSCSNSPALPFPAALKRHNNNKHRFSAAKSRYDDVSTFSAVQKVLEILNNENYPLPGFGKSPIGKQLRVTDSPFPITDQGDTHVDLAAEEFIKNFYKNLNLQREMAPFDSPYHAYWDR